MIPLFRSFISLPAGIERMNFLRFTLITTLGSLIWNTIFVVAGFVLGEDWHRVEEYAGVFQKIVIAAVVIAVGLFVTMRLRARRQGATGAADLDATVILPAVKPRSHRREK